ncbi:hypothetical protein E2C01_095445 [Portunus trituberculatus]|uniref:Uncharacterized protein n=1 Tax=Portunus trituberculatus TaxID=210409 RepID=A0A5B7K486_PORTR|nr:hypothetical protein [Portunus trituberculatus]
MECWCLRDKAHGITKVTAGEYRTDLNIPAHPEDPEDLRDPGDASQGPRSTQVAGDRTRDPRGGGTPKRCRPHPHE